MERKLFFGEPFRKIKVEESVKNLKNGKAACKDDKDEVTRDMIEGGGGVVWTEFGSCVIWPLRVLLCLKTRGWL